MTPQVPALVVLEATGSVANLGTWGLGDHAMWWCLTLRTLLEHLSQICQSQSSSAKALGQSGLEITYGDKSSLPCLAASYIQCSCTCNQCMLSHNAYGATWFWGSSFSLWTADPQWSPGRCQNMKVRGISWRLSYAKAAGTAQMSALGLADVHL